MATVTINSDRLIIQMHGWDAIFAIRREINIALGNIVSVEAGSLTSMLPNGIRVGGTYFPGKIAAGSYWSRRNGWSFWSVRTPDKAIDLRLRDERFNRIVVEVDDPHATAAMIESAIGHS